jgi:sugar/nucleoside kinase (ribokinase family)
MARVFGFGSAALDFRISTADYGDGYRSKLLAREELVLGGGSVANCLVQAARLGSDTFWLGKLGADWIGDHIVNDLGAEGVDCSRVLRDPTLCSPFNVAAYTDRHRIGGFLLPNSLDALETSDVADMTDDLQPDDWVVVEVGEIELGIVEAFCQMVRNRGAGIVVDVDLDPIKQCVGPRGAIDDILGAAKLIVPNVSAMATMYPGINARDLAHRMTEDYEVTTVVTAGERGAFWCEVGELVREQESPDVDVVDTVGAGDAFHGGLLHALATGDTISDAVALAVRCGAAACTEFGAREGMLRATDLQ